MKLIRKLGSTSQILQIFIRDSSSTTGAGLTGLVFNTASLTAYYHRDTDTTATAIALVTMTVGTFTSSGFKEIDATNMPGWYQFCPPNAALASGASSVGFHLKGATNMAPLPIEIDLDGQVDVTSWNGTAVASPATAGIPDVNVKNINNVSASAVTTVKAVQGLAVDGVITTVTNQLTGAAIATAIWTDTTAGDFTTSLSIGKSILNGVTLGTGLTVARCTLTDTLTTYTGNTVQTGDSFARIGATGSGLSSLAPASTALSTAVWTAPPTGFLAATFPPGTIANTTNITAGTITTATNVTNVSSGGITRATFAADTGLQSIRSNTAQAGAAGTITLDASASAVNSFYNNCLCYLTGGTGVGQSRFITGYVGATKVATLNSNWATTPDNTTTFAIMEFDNIPGGTAPTATAIATAVWQDATSGDFTVASSIGKSLYTSGVVPGGTNGLLIAGTNSAVTFANITSTGAMFINGVSDVAQTGDSFARIGATGSGLTSLAPSSTALSTAIWTNTLASNIGTTNSNVLTNLDAAVSSRMATYTQPTGFLAATFPASIASPTNITAGTITTVTNLTNAATAGDFTATMKTSIGTAVAASAVASVTGNVSGNVTGSVGSVASGGITRATFAADTGLQSIRSNTAQAGGATTITLDAGASATNSFYNNCLCYITGGTGVGQSRFISSYVGATKVATVSSAWSTNPDNTSTFAIEAFDIIPGSTAPTVAQIATAVWQDTTSGDFTVASSIGKSLYTSGNAPGAASGIAIVGSNMGTVTSVSGSVGSVTGNVGGNVVGSVASVTARVTANTDQLAGQTVTAAAGVTFPASIASPTNITAGIITTVTNLTNAPTAGDFTATMKTSIGTAVAASAVASVTGNVGGNVVGSVGSISGITFPTNFSLFSIDASGRIILQPSGMDAVLVESGIVATAALTNDNNTQLTSINARQALALTISPLAGLLSGAATTLVNIKAGGNPAGNTRVAATVDASGNRTASNIKVPT